MSNVKCQMSNVKCQMSDVRCQMSDVKCQMSILLFLFLSKDLEKSENENGETHFCHLCLIFSIQCAQIFIPSCCRLILAVVSGANGANKWRSLIPLLCFLPALNHAFDFFKSLVSGLPAFFVCYSLFF